MFKLYAQWVVKHPQLSLALAFVLALGFAYGAKDVRLNNHFAVLFAIDNEANAYRDFYRSEFGADDGLLMAIIQAPEAQTAAVLKQIEAVTDTLSQYPHYIRVLSPTNASVIRSGGIDNDEVFSDPLFGIYADPEQNYTLAAKLELMRNSPATAGRLVSTHANTFAILAEMPSDFDRFKKIEAPAEYFQQQINSAFSQLERVKIDYAGVPYTRIGILKLMHQDLIFLVPLTSLIVAIFSFWIFRSLPVLWITFLTTVFGLACTAGLMGLNNDDINQLTITFPVLLMVIVVANGIHFFHRYFRELQQGKTVEQAVLITATHVSKAAFLSCFTTMIGFYALLTADMEILRSFGLYLGSGVILSYVGMILIIPPCLLLSRPQSNNIKDFSQPGLITRFVANTTYGPKRLSISVIGTALLFLGAYLASQASYDYFLKDMLADDHPQVIAGEIADQQLSGALPLEISLLGQAGDFKQPQVLNAMLVLNQWLAEHGLGGHGLSLATVIKALNKAFSGEDKIPDSSAAVAQLLILAEGSPDQIVEQLVNDDYQHARIRVNGPDLGAARLVELKSEFERFAALQLAGTGVKATMTGEAPVAYEGMNKLSQELMHSVLTALVFIVVTIFIVFRDWRLALGSIFPNVLPIILGLAFYALSGQALNPLPGIAFCIAIGIAVDDTVHLFARFNEELGMGKSRRQAVLDSVQEVKGALLSSSIILSAGFSVFLLSGFAWNRDLGWLGASLIIIALIADLVFTPAILSFGSSKTGNRNSEALEQA